MYEQTYPELGGGGNRRAVLDGAGFLLWTGFGHVVGASVVSTVTDEGAARRLQVLAADDEGWRSVHEAVIRRLARAGVQRRYVTVREDCTRVVSLLGGLGYQEFSRSWGARLVVTHESLPYLRSLAAGGPADVRLRSLAVDDAAATYALRRDHRADFPVTPATPIEDYSPERIASLLAGGRSFGAWVGDELVSVTLMESSGSAAAETDFTVTAAHQRGRGIATALKAFAVCRLAEQGVRIFGTGGAGINEASRRANLRLGYQLEPMWLTYAAG